MRSRSDVHARAGAGSARDAPGAHTGRAFGPGRLGGRSLRLVRSISHRRRRSGQRGVSAVFRLGQEGVLARLCEDAGLQAVTQQRISATLNYVDADHACDAAFVGGPVALAWARFDHCTRKRVRSRYLQAIAPWWQGRTYRVPVKFVLIATLR